jgi:L-aspartate oxidase
LVWGARAARDIAQQPRLAISFSQIFSWASQPVQMPPADVEMQIQQMVADMRRVMWQNVGIVRTATSLQTAQHSLNELLIRASALLEHGYLNDALIGLRNSLQAAQYITQSALENHQSRGAHFRADANVDANGYNQPTPQSLSISFVRNTV